MDYYYALLENYKQLKQRKFKLSLREGEKEDAEAKVVARQKADSAFATPKEITPDERKTMANGPELVFVKSGPELKLTSAIGGPFKSMAMKGVNSLDELNPTMLSKVIGYFMEDEPAVDEPAVDEPAGDQKAWRSDKGLHDPAQPVIDWTRQQAELLALVTVKPPTGDTIYSSMDLEEARRREVVRIVEGAENSMEFAGRDRVTIVQTLEGVNEVLTLAQEMETL